MLSLRERITRVVRRSRAFYGARTPGHYLVRVKYPVAAPQVPPLDGFDLDRQLEEWLDCQLASDRPAWRDREGLDDDSLPAACPYFGIAEHSAWLGQEVILQQTTCLSVPLLRSPAALDSLVLSTETPWFRYMKRGYEHLRRRQDGNYILSVRGLMSPFDLANALRGDELFLDVMLQPEFVHRLLRFLTPALRWYYDHLLSWTDDVEGGRVFMAGIWGPSPCMGHLSNDAAMLCAPRIYSCFGLPYERELTAGCDWVLYHVHNDRMHFVPELARLPGLSLLEISEDPKTTPPLADAARILANSGRANLMLAATSGQLRAHLDDFAERNVFFSVRCRDRQDAADIIRLVRSRSRPLEAGAP